MSEPKPARPSQVTLAGWLVVAGSVVVVLMAFSQVAELRSLKTRDAVEEYLSKPPGDSLGLGVQGVLNLLKVASMIAAASAAASAILGWQVLQRSKGARVALSVLAVPLFVSGLFFSGLTGGGVIPAMVTAAIVMLWFQPARDWFDGISRPAPTPATPPAPAPPAATPPTPTSTAGHDPLLDLPPPTQPPLHPTAYAAAPGRAAALPARRPGATTWACILTWLTCAGLFGILAMVVLALLADPGIIDDARRQSPDLAGSEMTDDALRNSVYATAALMLPWCAVAVALAVLVWRRVRWAAIALVVSAGLAGLLCLIAMIGSFVFLVPLAACSMTVALLLRPESQAWLRASARPGNQR